jgi:RNA polymerase sigma factor (sigma-70 family)
MVPPADADDATQEALIKVLHGLRQFRGEAKFSTWAWSVATRCIIDFRRGAFRQPLYSFDQFSEDLADGRDMDAQEQAEDRVHLGQLMVGCARALLMCLDAEHRLAYVVGEVMQQSGEAGAEVCGIAHATFRKRLSRAREQIHGALDRQCGIINTAAPCRCHRRLDRARTLGRVGSGPHVDVTRLAAVVRQLESLSDRAAAFYGAAPREVVPDELVDRLRAM